MSLTRGPWFITPTAVRQYAKHIRSNFEEAQQELIALSIRARYVRDDTSPLEVWAVDSPSKIKMLVSFSKRREGDKPQLVTVIPERSLRYDR